ncbi:MAG TPA: alpha/beta hydrolase [Xanthobacteraceae bacterium]|nr:alpha/beta hydrolase [Xanthobacteraceae bacterium]
MLRAALRLEKRLLGKRQRPMPTLRKRLALLGPFVPGRRRYTQMTPVDAGGVPGVLAAVAQSRPDRCVLYFHGGGYCIGTAALYRDFLWRIAAAACAQVLYFDYRLAPEHAFPAALDDAVAAYRWLVARFDRRHVAFAGDSAGGGLMFATLLRLRDEGVELPRAAAAVSPWTDLTLSGPSLRANADADPMLDPDNLPELVHNYCAAADPRNPYISPVYGDPAGLPPALIQAGSDEILRDDAVRMGANMRAAGCEAEVEIWEEMPHVWHLYARLIPEGRRAVARIGEFLQARM